jgi:hypothetical protein
MKAKDLAELLLQYPDFEVQGCFCDTSNCTIEHYYPNYYKFNVIGIADIGHSDKVIILDYD